MLMRWVAGKGEERRIKEATGLGNLPSALGAPRIPRARADAPLRKGLYRRIEIRALDGTIAGFAGLRSAKAKARRCGARVCRRGTPPITHIRLFKGACREHNTAGCRWADGGPTLILREKHVYNDASDARGRCSFRPPDTLLESQDGAVHFWRPQQDSHRQPRKDAAKYNEAMTFVRKLSANKGNILFVGTKRQAREIMAEEATRCASPYVDQRWLGGMLTNFKTIKQSIKRLKDMESMCRRWLSRAPRQERGADDHARTRQDAQVDRWHQGHGLACPMRCS
jgi:hypothetical protein